MLILMAAALRPEGACFSPSFIDTCGEPFTLSAGFLICRSKATGKRMIEFIAKSDPFWKIKKYSDVVPACESLGGEITEVQTCEAFESEWKRRPAADLHCPLLKPLYLHRCCPSQRQRSPERPINPLAGTRLPTNEYGWALDHQLNLAQYLTIHAAHPRKTLAPPAGQWVTGTFIVVLRAQRDAIVKAVQLRLLVAAFTAEFSGSEFMGFAAHGAPELKRAGAVMSELAAVNMAIFRLSPTAVQWLAARQEVLLVEADYTVAVGGSGNEDGGVTAGGDPRNAQGGPHIRHLRTT